MPVRNLVKTVRNVAVLIPDLPSVLNSIWNSGRGVLALIDDRKPAGIITGQSTCEAIGMRDLAANESAAKHAAARELRICAPHHVYPKGDVRRSKVHCPLP